MNLAKEMKKKRDAEKRLEQNSPTTIFVESGNGGEKSYNDYSNFATKKQLNDGLEEKADIEHSHKFIDLEDSPLSYVGQAGKSVKVKATEDGLEFGEGGGGGDTFLPNFMSSDEDGIKGYDSELKNNLIAIIGRKIDETLSVETSLIPIMTSNTTPSGVASASSQYSIGYAAWKAFDGVISTNDNVWITSSTKNGWIAYEFTEPKIVNKYSIRSRNDAIDRNPTSWTFEGWNGIQWVVLDTKSGITNWTYNEKKIFNFANNTPYIKYRINVTLNNGGTTLQIQEIEFINVTVGSYIYGIFTDQYLEKLASDTLPTASVNYRGQIFTLLSGAGVADIPYICIKDSSDIYIWKEINLTL